MSGQPKTVLIVEDNKANLDLTVYVLEHAGWKTLTAMNAQEALDALKGPPPDLILLDVQLPGCDGVTLLAELRLRPGFAKLPVIALTAHAMRGDRERFLAAGFNGYIAKPIKVKTFPQEVEECLKGAEGEE